MRNEKRVLSEALSLCFLRRQREREREIFGSCTLKSSTWDCILKKRQLGNFVRKEGFNLVFWRVRNSGDYTRMSSSR
jgi:hypothetical protein